MSFLTRIFKKQIREVSITFCGLSNAGKTSIVKYLETGEFVSTQPTMGVNRGEALKVGKLLINIFDLGGQEDFRQLWSQVNEKSDGIVFVVDKTDIMHMDEANKVFHEVIETQIHKDVVILILLHKSDVLEGMDRSKFIEEFNLNKLHLHWACYETSAKTGQNIFESFVWFFDSLKEVTLNG